MKWWPFAKKPAPCAHAWDIRVVATSAPKNPLDALYPIYGNAEKALEWTAGFDDLLLTCLKCGAIRHERVIGQTGKNLGKNVRIPDGM